MNNQTRDPFNHPHAKIIKRLVEDYFKTLAGKVTPGQAKLRIKIRDSNNDETDEKIPTYRADLLLTNSGEGIMRPVGAEIDFVTDYQKHPSAIKKLTNSYETTINALDFFLKHNYEHYIQENMTPLLEIKEVCKATIDLIKKLDPYCLSATRYWDNDKSSRKRKPFINSDGVAVKFESYILIRFVLKDEHCLLSDGVKDSGFMLSLFIMSPAEAMRTLFYYRNGKNK